VVQTAPWQATGRAIPVISEPSSAVVAGRLKPFIVG
jgi:hypothetical protein